MPALPIKRCAGPRRRDRAASSAHRAVRPSNRLGTGVAEMQQAEIVRRAFRKPDVACAIGVSRPGDAFLRSIRTFRSPSARFGGCRGSAAGRMRNACGIVGGWEQGAGAGMPEASVRPSFAVPRAVGSAPVRRRGAGRRTPSQADSRARARSARPVADVRHHVFEIMRFSLSELGRVSVPTLCVAALGSVWVCNFR